MKRVLPSYLSLVLHHGENKRAFLSFLLTAPLRVRYNCTCSVKAFAGFLTGRVKMRDTGCDSEVKMT